MIEASPIGNEEIADWLECLVLSLGSKVNPTHKLVDLSRDWANLSELQVSSGLKTMERRGLILGDKYPFVINNVAVILNEEKALSLYSYLLFITRPSNSLSWQSSTPTQLESDLFEQVVAHALADYLGGHAEAIPFGWPSKYGRPQEFHLAIDWLASKMGVKLGSGFRPPRRKDGGVDVVAWKPFGDKRSGFPIFLVQCTLQKDFISKSRDIDLRLWSGWLELDRDPTTILAVPRTIASGEPWNEVTANSIIFERLRIVESSNTAMPESQKDYSAKVLADFKEFARTHLA